MDKNIYDMLNDIKTDADEQLENGSFEELSEFETKKIMSKITGFDNKNSKKSNIKKYIPAIVGIAAAAAVAVSLWLWKGTNKVDDSSNGIVAVNDVTTETPTEVTTEVTTADTTETTTEKEQTTEDDTTVTIEKHNFEVKCASMNTKTFASGGDASADYGFNVPVWKTYGVSGDICFTRMLFTVEGEGVKRIHVSIDKCDLYRQDATDANIDEFLYGDCPIEKLGLDEVTDTKTWTFYDPFGEIESVDTIEVVGNDYSCDYSAGRKFGFYIPLETRRSVISDEEIEEIGDYDWSEFDRIVDLLRDAKLTIEVTYEDGSTEKKVYNVHPGYLEYYTIGDFCIPTTTFAAEGEDSTFGIVLEEVSE
ncbi:MAG: hypothetical protein J5929_09890 [Eubacterium sp.]|nr:hypothetical protein [Eubacterium sp.]